LTHEQGDQIGPIFAYWAIVHFGRFFNHRRSPYFWYTFYIVKVSINFDLKNGLGNILGDFFTNKSGHPAPPSLGGKVKYHWRVFFIMNDVSC
jgi:hypothetical protein